MKNFMKTITTALLLGYSIFANANTENSKSKSLGLTKMEELCFSKNTIKFRTVELVNGSVVNGLPTGGINFEMDNHLIGFSSINVYMDDGKTAYLSCYYESVKFSRSTKMIDGVEQLNITIDENKITKSEHLDSTLSGLKMGSPYGWSTSDYYRDVMKRVDLPAKKSEVDIFSDLNLKIDTYYKLNVKIIPSTHPKYQLRVHN